MTTSREQTTRHDPRTRPRTTTRDEDQHQPTKTPRTIQDTKERPGPDYITTRGPRQQENQRTTTNHEDETTNHENNHEASVPQSPRRYRERIFFLYRSQKAEKRCLFPPAMPVFKRAKRAKKTRSCSPSPRSAIPLARSTIIVVCARSDAKAEWAFASKR